MWGGSVVLWCRALKVARCQAGVGRASTSERRGRVGRGAVQPARRSAAVVAWFRVAKLGLLGTRKSQPPKKTLETMSSQKNPNDFKGNHGKNQVRVENPKLCLVRNPSLEYEELLVF